MNVTKPDKGELLKFKITFSRHLNLNSANKHETGKPIGAPYMHIRFSYIENIVLGSNIRSGDFDRFTRFEVP